MTLTVDYDKHHITIHRFVRDHKRAIAACSCGWHHEGSIAEVYTAASGHDFKLAIPEATNAQANR